MFTALHTSLIRNTVYINVITADNFFEIVLSTVLLFFCIFSAANAVNIHMSTENAAPIMTEYIFFTKYGTADNEKASVHKTIIVCSCLTDIFLFSNVFIYFHLLLILSSGDANIGRFFSIHNGIRTILSFKSSKPFSAAEQYGYI